MNTLSTEKTNFYLSKGILMEIYNRKSLFNASAIANEVDGACNGKVNVRYNRRPIIVQVVEIVYFSEQQVFGITLFDGTDTLETILDMNKWHKLHCKYLREANLEKLIDDYQCNNTNLFIVTRINQVQVGSVIILCEYTFVNVQIVTEPGYLQDVIAILDFSQIGYQNIQEIKLDNTKTIYNLSLHRKPHSPRNSSDLDKKQSYIIQRESLNKSAANTVKLAPTHSISFLSLSLSHQKWQIKGKLCRMGRTKEFKNQFSGKDGKLLRIQVTDDTGAIEVVAFNDEIQKLELLILNETYFISNADIKKSNPNFSVWTDEIRKTKNEFELCVTKDTCFILCNDENDASLSSVVENFNNVTSLSQETKSSKANSSSTSASTSADKCTSNYQKYKIFIPLLNVSLQKEGSLINVIGIINKIDDIKTITPKNKEPIKIKNFYLIDQANKELKVALWGNQAEEFRFSIGTILILKKVKLTTFSGVSLSIQWETVIDEYLKEWTHIEEANDLRDWWDYDHNQKQQQEIKQLKRKMSYSNSLSEICSANKK